MSWLTQFAETARSSDQIAGRPDHVAIMATGLFGEAGSLLAEFKKAEREHEEYRERRARILEEFGDFVWYFVRLVALTNPHLLDEFGSNSQRPATALVDLEQQLKLGAAVGDALSLVVDHVDYGSEAFQKALRTVWQEANQLAASAGISIQSAAEHNAQKTHSRWPLERTYKPLFDVGFPPEEQLPRQLEVEFLQRSRGQGLVVFLRSRGLTIGDSLTDNIRDPDGYRFHDVFHFAHLVHLGWSPVIRSLLRCKRKSDPVVDETEDGARAIVLEEAISALVFSRARDIDFFAKRGYVDYELLKMVSDLTRGFEVHCLPLWQWEAAILAGFSAFRELQRNEGGRLALDLPGRRLSYLK